MKGSLVFHLSAWYWRSVKWCGYTLAEHGHELFHVLLHSFRASLTAIFLLLVYWVTLFQRLVTPARGLDSSQQGSSTTSCETFTKEKMTIGFRLKTASRRQLSDSWCRWYDHDWPTRDHSSDNRNSCQDFLGVLSRVSIANFHRELAGMQIAAPLSGENSTWSPSFRAARRAKS